MIPLFQGGNPRRSAAVPGRPKRLFGRAKTGFLAELQPQGALGTPTTLTGLWGSVKDAGGHSGDAHYQYRWWAHPVILRVMLCSDGPKVVAGAGHEDTAAGGVGHAPALRAVRREGLL